MPMNPPQWSANASLNALTHASSFCPTWYGRTAMCAGKRAGDRFARVGRRIVRRTLAWDSPPASKSRCDARSSVAHRA